MIKCHIVGKIGEDTFRITSELEEPKDGYYRSKEREEISEKCLAILRDKSLDKDLLNGEIDVLFICGMDGIIYTDNTEW